MTQDEKLDRIDGNIEQIKITLAKQHEQLSSHIRRTELLEARMEPVEKHVWLVAGALKLVSVLALVATAVEVVVQWLHKS